MAKVIQQETYDDVIKENIVEFSMSVEEARAETITQFEAQGVNLANIIKDFSINEKTGQPVLNETIESLKNHVDKKVVLERGELEMQLETLMSESSKSVPHRVHAGKADTQDYLLQLIDAEIERGEGDGHVENSVSCASDFV
jgi:armadillo repeat-containing protein 6